LTLYQLFEHSKVIKYPAKSIILAQGQNTDTLFYLMEGRIKLYVISPDGRERIIQFINGGDTFGEPSAFTGIPNGFMAMTIEPCNVKSLSKDKIIEMVRSNPALAESLIFSLSHKLLQLGKMLANKSLDLPETVAKTLLNLLKQTNHQNKIFITHQELADYIGVSRASISSSLQLLENEGFIQKKRESIEIADLANIKEWLNTRSGL
jgi:CRP/FNR family cyclic AMP-dependent transcriptional regulator